MPTREQLMAINSAFASDPGVSLPQDMAQAKQNPIMALLRSASGQSPPVMGGDAPPLAAPAVAADMPVPPVAPVDPAAVEPYPGIHPDLHDKLVGHFQAQAQQAAQMSEAARAFLGPNGEVGQTYLNSLDKIKEAGDITQSAEQKKAVGEAELARKQADQAAQDTRADEQRMAKRDKMVKEYQTKANVLADQAQSAEVRDFWADKSTGSRILGILAQTLSGAANGLAGNPGAPSALDRIIDRDLEKQKSNIQNKRLAADHATNALGQVFRGFESEDASIAAYRQAAAKWYAAKSNELTAQFGGDTAPAKNQMVQAQAQQVIAKSQAELAQHGADAADRLHLAADDNLAQLSRDDAGIEEARVNHQSDTVEVPGVSVPIRKQLANDWQKKVAPFADVLGQYDEVEKLVNKPGFNLKDKAQADAANSFIEAANRTLQGTGANLSAYEERNLKKTSVDYLKSRGVNAISELSGVDYKDYIHAMRKAVATTLRARTRTLGIGADLRRDAGFESAYDAVHEDDAK